jgi:hypothetical protein
MEESDVKEEKKTLAYGIRTFRSQKRQNDRAEAVRPPKAVNKNDETGNSMEEQKPAIF